MHFKAAVPFLNKCSQRRNVGGSQQNVYAPTLLLAHSKQVSAKQELGNLASGGTLYIESIPSASLMP